MEDRQRQATRGCRHSPIDRLRRDVAALGRLDAKRPSARRRLVAELGDELVAAIQVELDRFDIRDFPLCTRPRRVA